MSTSGEAQNFTVFFFFFFISFKCSWLHGGRSSVTPVILHLKQEKKNWKKINKVLHSSKSQVIISLLNGFTVRKKAQSFYCFSNVVDCIWCYPLPPLEYRRTTFEKRWSYFGYICFVHHHASIQVDIHHCTLNLDNLPYFYNDRHTDIFQYPDDTL